MDPLQARHYLKTGQNIVSLDNVPSYLKRQSEVFRNEFLIPAGYNHTLELFVRRNSRIIAGISLQRHKDDHAFTDHELNIIAKARNFIEFRLLHQSPATLLQYDNRAEQLTLREEQTLALLCRGLSYQAIALELDIAASTVKSHIQNIYSKLGVGNRNELFVRLLGLRENNH
jgi:DNA-binding CsgD family transcriptional regulator